MAAKKASNDVAPSPGPGEVYEELTDDEVATAADELAKAENAFLALRKKKREKVGEFNEELSKLEELRAVLADQVAHRRRIIEAQTGHPGLGTPAAVAKPRRNGAGKATLTDPDTDAPGPKRGRKKASANVH